MSLKTFCFRFLILVAILLSSCGVTATASQEPTEPVASPQAVEPTPTPEPSPPGSVAILVVDDFITKMQGFDLGLVKEKVSQIDPTQNCVYTPDGQLSFLTAGATAYSAIGASTGNSRVPHGVKVYNDLVNTISNDASNTNYRPQPALASWTPNVDMWSHNGYDLMIVTVDTDNYDTTTIRDHIQEAIKLIGQNYGIGQFVINLSFVMIPCNFFVGKSADELYAGYDKVLSEYSASPKLQGLKGQLNELEKDSNGKLTENSYYRLAYDQAFGSLRLMYAYTTQITNEGNKYFDGDPLYKLLNDLVDAKQAVPVGSAGNDSLPYPYAPATWDSVISVSSYDCSIEVGNKPTPLKCNGRMGFAGYSNAGEVMLDGFAPVDDDYGTSYAAPKLSYLVALHLLNSGQGNECANSLIGRIIRPVIGYSDGTGPWDNRTVDDVETNICPDFAP